MYSGKMVKKIIRKSFKIRPCIYNTSTLNERSSKPCLRSRGTNCGKYRCIKVNIKLEQIVNAVFTVASVAYLAVPAGEDGLIERRITWTG